MVFSAPTYFACALIYLLIDYETKLDEHPIYISFLGWNNYMPFGTTNLYPYIQGTKVILF